MTGLTSIYRTAKKIVDSLPAWLFRFRPFGVYEIPVYESAAASRSHDASRWKLDCQVRWVADQTETATLRRVASQESIAALNFTTRRAAAAWLEGQVVACVWIASESFEEADLGLRFELQPSEVWLFAAMVDPPQRNQGVYGQLLKFLTAEFVGSDVRRILLGVTLGNELSHRAHSSYGAMRIGTVVAVRILGFTLCFRSGRVWRLSPLAFTRRQPVRLAVNP
jgi:hypothetical protein